MKYIRTQAGVYEIKNGKFMGFDIEKYSRDFPVRFADNIEDLCDAFVLVCPDTHKKMRVLQSFYNTISLVKWDRKYPSHYEYVHKVYGAIWTDKGLIYVAKMNEKGEFELLYDK